MRGTCCKLVRKLFLSSKLPITYLDSGDLSFLFSYYSIKQANKKEQARKDENTLMVPWDQPPAWVSEGQGWAKKEQLQTRETDRDSLQPADGPSKEAFRDLLE